VSEDNGGNRDYGRGESDVDDDAAVAGSRVGGGDPDEDASDANSTTGTTPSGEFVGRAGGVDTGYDEETGAEARAAAGDTGPV
jgi:hypothetical protein